MENEYNDMTEVYIGTGRNDNKGREVGWIVGLNNNGTTFAAWVQNARKVNGEWKEFGAQQRSRSFPSQATATAWAYATATHHAIKPTCINHQGPLAPPFGERHEAITLHNTP